MATLQSLTEDTLIEVRNWANRVQWCAHELLDELLSEESQRLLKEDRLLFLRSRWNVRQNAIQTALRDANFDIEVAFRFLRDIGEIRGRHFGHSGIIAKFAHQSASAIADSVFEVVGPPLHDSVSPTVAEIEETTNELRALIRWNPKELESQLFEECEFAINHLRTWEAESEKVRLRLFDELRSLQNYLPAEIGQTTSERHAAPANNVSAADATTPSPVTPPFAREDPPKHKLEVNQIACMAILDGKQIPVTSQQALALQILLDNKGETVSLASHQIRSREIKALPPALNELVHAQPGGGTRMRRDKVEMA